MKNLYLPWNLSIEQKVLYKAKKVLKNIPIFLTLRKNLELFTESFFGGTFGTFIFILCIGWVPLH